MMTTLVVGGVAAEDLPLPDPDGLELPYDTSMPSDYGSTEYGGVPLPDAEELPPATMPGEPPSRLVTPPQSSSTMSQMNTSLSSTYSGDGMSTDEYGGAMEGEYYGEDPGSHAYPWDGQPAPIESSGTWLNRGVWYTEFDAVILHRIWGKGDMFMAAEDPNITIPNQLPSFGLLLNTNRTLYLPVAHPGGDAGVRGTLGRFLFRDSHNRDHTAEFTAWAAGNWNTNQRIESADPNGLFVTFNLAGENGFFDGSTVQDVNYDSRLNSFEANYRLKKRLGRDQLVMDPNGGWRRESSSGFNRNYLAGFRYIQLNESLTWTADDILVTGANGKYVIDTTNDLFGFQMGAGIEYETGRWSLGVSAKSGLFWNNAESHQQMLLTANPEDDFNRTNSEAELSYLGEAEVLSRWHITPNASLRAGLEVLVIGSTALAPRQIDFIGGTNNIETGGSPWYMGGLLGFECYW
jgi:hypothetical protein